MTHMLSGQWTEGGGERSSYKRAPHTLSRLKHRTLAFSSTPPGSVEWGGHGNSHHPGAQLAGTGLLFSASVPLPRLALRLRLLKFHWLRLKLWCWAAPGQSPRHRTPARHPADGQELQPQAPSGHTRLLTAAGGLRGSKESQGHLNGQTSAPLTE